MAAVAAAEGIAAQWRRLTDGDRAGREKHPTAHGPTRDAGGGRGSSAPHYRDSPRLGPYGTAARNWNGGPGGSMPPRQCGKWGDPRPRRARLIHTDGGHTARAAPEGVSWVGGVGRLTAGATTVITASVGGIERGGLGFKGIHREGRRVAEEGGGGRRE